MGLSTASSHVVWFVAFVSVAALATDALWDVNREVREGRETRLEVDRELLRGRLDEGEASWDEGTNVTSVTAWNRGSAPLDLLNVTVLVDGVPQTDVVASVPSGSNVWLPDEEATFTLTDQPPPGRIVLVTAGGLFHYVYPPRYIASIVLTPSSAQVEAGESVTFTAEAIDVLGEPFEEAEFVWETNAGTMVQLGSASARLDAQTLAASGLTVWANLTNGEGVTTGTAAVTVVAGPVASVTVSPASATVEVGGTQAFTASAYDAYGNPVEDATFSWDAILGTVDASGLYTAPGTVGSDEVNATAEGVTGTAAVEVVQTVHVDAQRTLKDGTPTSTFRKGDTVTVETTVRDGSGALVAGANVTLEIRDTDSVVRLNATADTNGSGVATFHYLVPSNAPFGTWTARVTILAGDGLTWNPAADQDNPLSFQVSNN